jgi:hypothetical protein
MVNITIIWAWKFKWNWSESSPMFDKVQSLKLKFIVIVIIIIMITTVFFVFADDYCQYPLMHYQEMSVVHMTITVKIYMYPSVLLVTRFIHQNLDTTLRINLFERKINCVLFIPCIVI